MTSAPFCAPQLNCCPSPFCFEPSLLEAPAVAGDTFIQGDGNTFTQGDGTDLAQNQ